MKQASRQGEGGGKDRGVIGLGEQSPNHLNPRGASTDVLESNSSGRRVTSACVTNQTGKLHAIRRGPRSLPDSIVIVINLVALLCWN